MLWIWIPTLFLFFFAANPTTSPPSQRLLKMLPLEESSLFVHGEASVGCFRIPVVLRTSNGTLIVAVEARKRKSLRWVCDDEGPKFIAVRRSLNDGVTWEPAQFILNDPSPEGLNLGVIFEESKSRSIFIQFTHDYFSPGNTIGFVVSRDEGRTWSQPVNVSEQIGTSPFIGGPGYGIRKRLEPHKDRLLFCGHRDLPIDGVQLLYSDDDARTWHWGAEMPGIPYGRPKKTGDFVPDECQVYEASNGDVVVNARNQAHFSCRCRFKLVSVDGGTTFSNRRVFVEEALPDSAISASVFSQDGVLFFSNPFDAVKRRNMSIHWSFDDGETWRGGLSIWPGGSGYSGLVGIKPAGDLGFGTLGLVFEKGADEKTYWHSIVFMRVVYVRM